MKGTSKNIDIADYFFGLLSNLNADSKLELIARLSNSLKTDAAPEEISLKSLFGAYNSDQTAEEIILEVRNSRAFNRKVDDL